MNITDGAAMDNWITGNWGEDQYDDLPCGDCPDLESCSYDNEPIDCEEEKKMAAAEARWELETGR